MRLYITNIDIEADRDNHLADVWFYRRNGMDRKQRGYFAVTPASLRRCQRAQLRLVEEE